MLKLFHEIALSHNCLLVKTENATLILFILSTIFHEIALALGVFSAICIYYTSLSEQTMTREKLKMELHRMGRDRMQIVQEHRAAIAANDIDTRQRIERAAWGIACEFHNIKKNLEKLPLTRAEVEHNYTMLVGTVAAICDTPAEPQS